MILSRYFQFNLFADLSFTGKWCCTKAMNSIRSRVGVAVMNRQLYAIGGFDGHDRLRTVEVYDPDWLRWRQVV